MASRQRRLDKHHSVRSALGQNAIRQAMARINALSIQEVAVRVERPFTMQQVIDWLFTAEHQRIAREARHVLQGYPSGYTNVALNENTTCRVEWDINNTWSIASERATLVSAAPLLKVRDQIKAIHEKWERVRAVVNWLDQNATLGGIRYYLPGILQLCSSGVPQETPSRFIEPLQIGPWIPLVREAQETIAATALLPKAPPKDFTFTVVAYTMRAPTIGSAVIEIPCEHRSYNV